MSTADEKFETPEWVDPAVQPDSDWTTQSWGAEIKVLGGLAAVIHSHPGEGHDLKVLRSYADGMIGTIYHPDCAVRIGKYRTLDEAKRVGDAVLQLNNWQARVTPR